MSVNVSLSFRGSQDEAKIPTFQVGSNRRHWRRLWRGGCDGSCKSDTVETFSFAHVWLQNSNNDERTSKSEKENQISRLHDDPHFWICHNTLISWKNGQGGQKGITHLLVSDESSWATCDWGVWKGGHGTFYRKGSDSDVRRVIDINIINRF